MSLHIMRALKRNWLTYLGASLVVGGMFTASRYASSEGDLKRMDELSEELNEPIASVIDNPGRIEELRAIKRTYDELNSRPYLQAERNRADWARGLGMGGAVMGALLTLAGLGLSDAKRSEESMRRAREEVKNPEVSEGGYLV